MVVSPCCPAPVPGLSQGLDPGTTVPFDSTRPALGAGQHQVGNMVLLDGLKLVSFSVALGGVTAAALTGTLAKFLFGVPTHDVLTFTLAPGLLGAVALIAVWIPAHRAARVDPAEVLRALQ